MLAALGVFTLVIAAIVSGPRLVSGRVTDLSGQPIPHARLVIIDVDREAGARPAHARVDAEGRFTLRATRGNNQLRVMAEGYSSMAFVRPAHSLWNRGWDFALPKAVSVSGRVVDTTGRPLPDRLVELVPVPPRRLLAVPNPLRRDLAPAADRPRRPFPRCRRALPEPDRCGNNGKRRPTISRQRPRHRSEFRRPARASGDRSASCRKSGHLQ